MPARPLILLAAALLTTSAAAADLPAGKRYALVIGVNEYDHPKLTTLKYAENDAADLSDELRKHGYEVTSLTAAAARTSAALSPTRENVLNHLKAVLANCRKGDVVVVALAGHGLQFGAEAYYCPKDARPFPDQTESLVSLTRLYADLDRSNAGMKVLLVDACRDDPTQPRSGSRGVDGQSAPKPPQGVAALFSCKAGERAFENDKLKHGVFFHHVIEEFRRVSMSPGGELTFAELAGRVSRRVAKDVPDLIGGGATQSPHLRADYTTEPLLAVRVELTVASAGGDYTTISAAIKAVPPGALIRVKPGTYREGLVLDKVVEIVGDGPREKIVIEAANADAVSMTADATVRGLTLRCVAGATQNFNGVDFVRGRGVLENCDVTSNSHAVILVRGTGTDPTMRRCRIADGKSSGVFVSDGGGGTFDDCDVSGNALAGVQVRDKGSAPTFTKCRFANGKEGGVLVSAGGGGKFDDCTMSGNALAGVEVRDKGSAPTFTKCQFADGKTNGVLVSDGGRGAFHDCTMTGNALAGVEVRNKGSAPTFTKCRFADGKSDGVLVSDGGGGAFDDCTMSGNALSGVEVRDKGSAPTFTKCQFADGKQCGVLVSDGGGGKFDDCTMSGNALAGVEVRDKGSAPTFTKCQFADGKTNGVLVSDGGGGAFDDCTMSGNALYGVEVRDKGSAPTFTKCRFADGKSDGVYVHDGGGGAFDDCTMSGNALSGVEVRDKGSAPTFTKCQFADGKQCGVLVSDGGGGKFDDCTMSGNALAGVAVRDKGSAPTFTKCRFANGKKGGVLVYDGGGGKFDDCTITGNAMAGVQVGLKDDSIGSHVKLYQCRIHRNGYEAVWVVKGSTATVEGCDLSGNKRGAFDIENGATVTRKNNKE